MLVVRAHPAAAAARQADLAADLDLALARLLRRHDEATGSGIPGRETVLKLLRR